MQEEMMTNWPISFFDSNEAQATIPEQVMKRSGEMAVFDTQKLLQSIKGSLYDVGMPTERSENILSRVLFRLPQEETLSTADVQKYVSQVLLDDNLPHVAKSYLSFAPPEGPRQPTYSKGLKFDYHFSKKDIHPFDDVQWEKREAKISGPDGNVVFFQRDVEAPSFWSQRATNIAAEKYFQGQEGMPNRETSIRHIIARVARTISDYGRFSAYFETEEDAQAFESELTYLLLHQKAAFNSPVWFNVGLQSRPQCSACFINSLQDDMHSIMHLATTEALLFKGGSGTGSNLSNLRSSKERLSQSMEHAPGPVGFMRGFDAFAGVMKSGGKSRTAAKMVILNADHPDVMDFISCKSHEEKKAWALIAAGYDGSIGGEAYDSIFYQNSNNSVRVTDEFMQAVEDNAEWVTQRVTDGQPCETLRAKDVFHAMAKAAWECGDPGIQYDTTINEWHMCEASGRINASNPCSEYMFLDDSACNLASLNLMTFQKKQGETYLFDVEGFKRAIEILITAMDILVEYSAYPTSAIEKNSHDFRPLGLGYANLGALLMSRGLAYDSDEGRELAAAITSLMTGHAYVQSALLAKEKGSFARYTENRQSVTSVLQKHRTSAAGLSGSVSSHLLFEARGVWDRVMTLAQEHGVRNAQISLLAPTGTISFLMDCDTTGIEPDIALVKYKWMVGGGMMKLTNHTVVDGLKQLGYTQDELEEIVKYIDDHDTIEGSPHLKEEHVSVFDCALRPKNGKRSIAPMGHIRMMEAVQPFLSGAISKTVNLPNDATIEDIEQIYLEGWKRGLKSIAVYRDGSKQQQAMTTTNTSETSDAAEPEEMVMTTPVQTGRSPRRRRLPDERKSVTHRFQVGSHKGYITVGLYDDGSPGELFITMSKEGSVISGLMDAFATSISMAFQYGVPLKVLVNKFVHMRFEPSGFTGHPQIRMAKSLVDYIFRWLALKFLPSDMQSQVGILVDGVTPAQEVPEKGKGMQEDLFSQASTDTAEDVGDNEHVATPVVPTQAEEEVREEEFGEEEVEEMREDAEDEDPYTAIEETIMEQVITPVVEVVEKEVIVRAAPVTAPAPMPVVDPYLSDVITFDNFSDAPPCDNCGSMMVRNATCYRCLNCGATTGCS